MFGIAKVNNISKQLGPVSVGAWISSAYTSGADDYGSICVDASGNIYHAYASVSLATMIGTRDIVVQKISSTGTVLWQSHFGIAAFNFYAPQLVTNGTTLFVYTSGGTTAQCRVVSFNASTGAGITAIQPYLGSTSGGATVSHGRICLSNGLTSVIMASSGPTSTASSNSFCITRTTTSLPATSTWQQRYNTTTLSENASVISHMIGDTADNFYSAYYDGAIVLVKVNTSGVNQYQLRLNSTIWPGTVTGSGNANGVLHINTQTAQPTRYAQLSATGVIAYEKTMTGLYFVHSFTDASNNCYFTGISPSNSTTVYVLKVDSAGVVQWQNKFTVGGSHSGPMAEEIVVDSGFIYIAIRVNHTTRSSDRLVIKIPVTGTGTGNTANISGGTWNYTTSTDITFATGTVTQPTTNTATVIATPASNSTPNNGVSTNATYGTNEFISLA